MCSRCRQQMQQDYVKEYVQTKGDHLLQCEVDSWLECEPAVDSTATMTCTRNAHRTCRDGFCFAEAWLAPQPFSRPSCYLPRGAGSYRAEEVQAAHEPGYPGCGIDAAAVRRSTCIQSRPLDSYRHQPVLLTTSSIVFN
jgi:hypothetical protein